jgi:class 3 adenylate cyclase/tetratricopeptide (TPR) repeat protein
MECGQQLGEPAALDYDQPRSYTPKFLADKILNSRSSVEGERKLVTVLFADVANYTSMSEKLDPEEVHQVMDGCFKILMDEIHKYEGTVNQFTGDGLMSLFGAPIAHEDHAQRACYAALSIQRSLIEYKETIEAKFGVTFEMRIGIDSGPVFVGSIGDDLRMDYTAAGDTTNLADRIQHVAKPGEVWISRETRNIIQAYFHEELMGEFPLKGKARPQRLYRIMSERRGIRTRFEAGLARGVTELVGRRREMEALRSAFEKAKSREGQVVDVVGEAGVGKSRLVHEFRKSIDHDATVLTGICVDYGQNVNFLPLVDVVKATFGIEDGMTEIEAGDRIKAKAVPNLVTMTPFYRSLLSLKIDDPSFMALNPEGRKFGTFEAVKGILLALSEKEPLVLFLEDVHWMDKISEEFFTYLSHCILEHPILMLSAYRPECTPSWARGTHYQRLGLETLSSNSSLRLVRNMLGGLPLDTDLEQKIVDKTGGNPFFVEEIVKELQERGDLVKAGDRYICKQPIDQCVIPNTVNGVLAARMDRLGEDLKRTMQVASVIGKDFAFRLLKSIIELGDELRARLNSLVGLEVIYEKALYPELEYVFKHALTQEVAYESLLKRRRQEIHGRIARAIEELYSEHLEEHYEMLAHHYERSGQGANAVNYLILAGEKSNRNSASRAACSFFNKANDVLESSRITLDPETEVRLHQGLGLASQDIADIGTALREYRKGLEISRRHGMVEAEMQTLSGLAWTMWWTPVREMKDEVIRFYNEGIARAQEMHDKATESHILALKGFYAAGGGQHFQGNQIIVDAEKMALETGNQRVISFIRILRAVSERWLGRPAKTIELTEGLEQALCSVFNLNQLSGLTFTRGLALAEFGRVQDAINLLKNGIDIAEKLGGVLFLVRLYNSLGYCYHEVLHPDRAWSLNLRSEELARGLMDRYQEGGEVAGEIVAQANVNLMENLFDKGKAEEAWLRIESFKKESQSGVYDRARQRWEVRMDSLAAEILLQRSDLDQAEMIVYKNLKISQETHARKHEGRFMRILGEIQILRKRPDNAISNLSESIQTLKEIGNPRQIWQAHASLASVLDKLGKHSEARDQWREAAAVIQRQAGSLSEPELRAGFLEAQPIREILAKTEN